MSQEFVCRKCNNRWNANPDKDGLFDGYGTPRCPKCGGVGCNPDDYRDYECESCHKKWRQYGNGGLVLGCIPKCPECRD